MNSVSPSLQPIEWPKALGSTTHQITIGPDWSVETPHDLDAERLSAAKLSLTSSDAERLPYLSHALFSMTTVVTDRVGVLAADEHWQLR